MSLLGKIFLGLALVGAIVAGVAGYRVVQMLNESKASLVSTQGQLKQAQTNLSTTKKNLQQVSEERDKITADLADATGKVDDLNKKIVENKRQLDELASNLKTAQDNETKAKSDLQTLNSQLDGKSVADYKTAVQKAQADLTAAQDSGKILADQLDAAQLKAAQLKDELNRKPAGDMPPGISGRIKLVNLTWNFVIIDVGIANNVVPNGELYVYRGNNLLGKVKVVTVEQNESVADIQPSVKSDIQVGDVVLN